MKNRYFGDINDYRKYGLLRPILEGNERKLGVCWLLTEDDSGGDGRRRDYLLKPEVWRHFDPVLYGKLRRLPETGVVPAVRYAESWDLLPLALYYSEYVNDDASQRRTDFDEASRRLSNSDLVFLDPDNGLQVPSVQYGKSNSAKYVYWREVEEAYACGHSLLIYQHFPHRPRDEFIATKINELRDRLPAPL